MDLMNSLSSQFEDKVVSWQEQTCSDNANLGGDVCFKRESAMLICSKKAVML